MLSQILIAIALLGGGSVPTAGNAESQWLSDLRADSGETRAEAIRELRTRLERGDSDAETIRGFLLTGLETDHVLRMEGSALADLMPAEALPHLAEGLSDPRPGVRSRAAIGLGAVGPGAATTLSQLVSLVRHDGDDVATAAGVAISRIDVAGETLPDLLEMLQEPNTSIRRKAVRALDYFDDRVHPIVAEMLPLLQDSDEGQRYWLVNVIANTKCEDPAVVEVLTELLRDDPSPFVRERVARELWEMGHSQSPIPTFVNEALVQALKRDPDAGVKEQAAKALGSNRLLLKQNRETLQECANSQASSLREVCHESIRGEYQ